MAKASLRKAVDPALPHLRYEVQTITPDDITLGNCLSWPGCSLLVMPGGRDLPYVDRLSGAGNAKIKEFIRRGGGYLGICAGAYYGCSLVEFAQGDPLLEVCGARKLALYPGTARGPTFPGFDYQSCAGARAAPIRVGTHLLALGRSTTEEEGRNPIGGRGSKDEGGGVLEPFPVFYNSGCHFIPEAPSPGSHGNVAVDFDVLATYVDSDPDPGGVATVEGAGVPSRQLAAIVAGGCGLGRVVLCGVHVETSAELLVEQYGGVAEGGVASLLVAQLASAERQREQLFRGIIRYLLAQIS